VSPPRRGAGPSECRAIAGLCRIASDGVCDYIWTRGRGVGGELLRLAEDKARQARLTKLSLIVFEANDGAKRLYERSGYVVAAREKVVPHRLIHHEGDALLMVKTLDFPARRT